MPCTKSWIKRSSRLMPPFFPSFSAVSTEITTSPRRWGDIFENLPSCIGNTITFVGPARLRYLLFSSSIRESSTIRMESSPSGLPKAFKMVWAFCRIFFRDILCLLCLLSIRTPILFLSITRFGFFGIFNAVMVYSV